VNNDERNLTRYLLGELTPDERAPIEDRIGRDASYFEALCALEDETILKWHRGELSDDERRLFTQTYLASPTRHARVESTRELIDVIERTRSAHDVHVPLWDRLGRWLAKPRQAPQFALAAFAALLVAVAGSAMYRMNVVMGQLQRVQHENVELRHRTTAAQRLAVAFTLSPVGERSQEATEGTNVVRIPREAAEVWLQFQIADPDASTGFDAVLESLERTHAATSRPARVERMATAALVTVRVAASDVPDGDYVLRLRRATVPSSAILDIVATRAFRVTHD
jgi:hypothetical protein